MRQSYIRGVEAFMGVLVVLGGVSFESNGAGLTPSFVCAAGLSFAMGEHSDHIEGMYPR